MIPVEQFGFWLDVTVNAITLVGLVVAGIAILIKRRQYRRNTFINKVSATLNKVENRVDGRKWLQLGSVYDGTVDDVFSEAPVRDAYLAAASRTTRWNPFVIIEDEKMRRAVLSDFVRHFQKADSLVALMQHLGVTTLKGVTIVGIPTFERFKSGDERWHMNRPWLFTPEYLQAFEGDVSPTFKAASDHGERVPWIHAFANIMAGKRTTGFTEKEDDAIKAMAIHLTF